MADELGIRRVRLQKGRHLVKRGKTWYLEECVRGLQTRRSMGTGDLPEATRRVAQGGEPVLNPVLKRDPPELALTLGQAILEYEEWYRKNRRESGADRALPVVQLFVDALGDGFDTKAITRDHVQKWVNNRVDGRASVTLRCDFGKVRAFLYWLAKRRDAVNPSCCRGLDMPRDDGLTKEAPSCLKVKAVLAQLRTHSWLSDFCRVLAETGMRPTELLGLRGTDVRDKLVSITPWEGRELKSKWSKRVIEVNEAASQILNRRRETMFKKTLPIFANRLGDVYMERSVFHLFKDFLGGGKLKKPPEELRMTLYDFRHFFCSEHAAPGPQHMEIEALAAYIGHSPASTQTLLRWYADQRALRRGAPPELVGEPREGRVIPLERSKSQAE